MQFPARVRQVALFSHFLPFLFSCSSKFDITLCYYDMENVYDKISRDLENSDYDKSGNKSSPRYIFNSKFRSKTIKMLHISTNFRIFFNESI